MEHTKASEKHSVAMNHQHYAGIPSGKRREILGGRQILARGDFEEVKKDHKDSEGSEFWWHRWRSQMSCWKH